MKQVSESVCFSGYYSFLCSQHFFLRFKIPYISTSALNTATRVLKRMVMMIVIIITSVTVRDENKITYSLCSRALSLLPLTSPSNTQYSWETVTWCGRQRRGGAAGRCGFGNVRLPHGIRTHIPAYTYYSTSR